MTIEVRRRRLATETSFGPVDAAVPRRRSRLGSVSAARSSRRRRVGVVLAVGVDGLGGGEAVAEARLSRLVLCTLTGTEEGRDGDGNQDRNDEHDHHQLDERESTLIVPVPPGPQLGNNVHCIPLWFVWLSNRSVRIVGNRPMRHIGHAPWQLEQKGAQKSPVTHGRPARADWGRATARRGPHGPRRGVAARPPRPAGRARLEARRPGLLHARGVPLVLRPRGELGRDPQGARRGARAPRRAPQLPGHLDRPGDRSPTTTGGRRSSSTASGSAPTPTARSARRPPGWSSRCPG